MRPCLTCSISLSGALFVSSVAWAETPASIVSDPAPSPVRAEVAPEVGSTNADERRFTDDLILDTGRRAFAPGIPGEMIGQIHGEYQLRYTWHTDPVLTPPAGAANATRLGQHNVLYHWFRISPRFDFGNGLTLVGQLDYPRGFVAGEATQFVGQASDAMSEQHPFGVDARWLYLEALTSFGHWRIGQQGMHWGMGMLVNDGNHPTLFGDYRRGSIAERVLFATHPAGRAVPFVFALSGDLIYRDNQADLTNRDRALQGTVTLLYGGERNKIGVHGIARRQTHDLDPNKPEPYTDFLSARIVDVFGKFTAPVPGGGSYVFGEIEAAVMAGTTSYVQDPALGPVSQGAQSLQSYGGCLKLGTVHETRDAARRWGDVVLALEWGYASGDSNPFDNTQRRFTFDPNHKVGLVLFDQVMHWMTARSATNADRELRSPPIPGLQYLPSNGGVSGVTYLYPTLVVRPRHWFDLKGAAVIAQTTADNVDPHRSWVNARSQNFGGGDSRRRDLGLEIDLGTEARIPLDYDVILQLGAQGGVLLPSHALDDAAGGMATSYLIMGRAGLQY